MRKKVGWLCMMLMLGCSVAMLGGCREASGNAEQEEMQNRTDTAAANDFEQNLGQEEAVADDVLAPLSEYVSDEDMAAADMWQSCNDAALAKVMRKAKNKEPVTIACIGGSITQGTIAKGQMDDEVSNSSPYAEIFHEWWQKRFPETDVTFVNAGIGGTDSYYGVHRLQKDVLSYEPDLVLVEYAVNDGDSNFYKRSYENLLRNILQSKNSPAVMLLFMAQTNGTSAQNTQVLVGFHYEVPMLSYANCIKNMMESGQYTAKQLSGDEVHPSALGHAIAGEILWKYLNEVYESMDQMEEPKALTCSTLTDERYQNANIMDAASLQPDSLGSFCENAYGQMYPNGWICKEGDGGLTVTMTFQNLGLLYLKTVDGKSGKYDIWIDGECVWSVDADFSGGWGNAITATEVYSSKEAIQHTVEIKKAPDSTENVFQLLGFLTS